MESRLKKIFSMGINIMSLAVWLGEDRKCSAAVVGLDLDQRAYKELSHLMELLQNSYSQDTFLLYTNKLDSMASSLESLLAH